ncbi:unnamed protein product [Symbiodinium microadriaticum]|nr:unnamed protein product [Symbiodinium microadriaticum]CAE7935435.1 unnamed protein product [Symbiodinium sp. KB8]
MPTPTKKQLRDVRQQLEDKKTLRGKPLSESQIDDLKIKEQVLLKRQREDKLAKAREREFHQTLAANESNRVIQHVEASNASSTQEISNVIDAKGDVILSAMAKNAESFLSAIAASSANPPRAPRQSGGKKTEEQKRDAEDEKREKREKKKREVEERKKAKKRDVEEKKKRKDDEKKRKADERKADREELDALKRKQAAKRSKDGSKKNSAADSAVKEDPAIKEDPANVEGDSKAKETEGEAGERGSPKSTALPSSWIPNIFGPKQ